jgi:hypothetical protein
MRHANPQGSRSDRVVVAFTRKPRPRSSDTEEGRDSTGLDGYSWPLRLGGLALADEAKSDETVSVMRNPTVPSF